MKIVRIEEAYEHCGVSRDLIYKFIQEDWVVPHDRISLELDDEDLARIQLINDLRENLGVNDEGVPIILHLLDQLNRIYLELSKSQYNN